MNKKIKNKLWLLLIPLIWWSSTQIGYAKNVTASMPYKHFLIWFSKNVKRGDYITFKAPKASYYQGLNITKQVIGMPGDKITTVKRQIYLNGKYIATAKPRSKTGIPLVAIASGVIQKNHYFVWVAHPDSYDSRYQDIGLINEKALVGISYPLW